MDLLEGLNEAQYEAVTTTEGPVMVMAGAGSGKTKVLTTRIAYIIRELGINPYGVLAVTFTNKAASEMKERLGRMLDMETKWLWVSTFHSFCVRLLRDESSHIEPYQKNFNIIDDDDQAKIMRDILKESEIDAKPKEVLKLISKGKNGMAVSIHDPEMQNYYPILRDKYNQYLVDNNLFDFDDLILKTIKLLRENEDVRNKYQEKFQYILVDEYQDTNKPQYELMSLLAEKHHNLFVVGDDFQSIYSFRGAKGMENINRMRNEFKNTKIILLEKNYRSTTEILNLANSVIEHNPNQIKKVMKSNNVVGDKPIYYSATSSFDEVSFVIEKIKDLKKKENLEYKDFAILYRANALSREFEDSLVKERIPYRIYGGLSFFARKEIKDIIAYLRLLINHNDDFSFGRIINEPKRKIGDAIISKLKNHAEENGNISLYDAIPYYVGSGMGASNLKEFKTKMDSIYATIENVKLPDLVDIIGEEMGYVSAIEANASDDEEKEDRLDNLKEFKSVLKESEEFYDGDSNVSKLEQLLQDLSLRTDKEELKDDNAVRLSTYHQAKGLEFNTVFMVAMEENIFPSMNAVTNADIEEERRICYVGVTRAKKHLFLTSAWARMRYGRSEDNEKSRFIREMDKDSYEIYRKPSIRQAVNDKASEVRRIPVSKPISNEPKKVDALFNVGDKISHKAFGNGIVVAVTGDLITVAFSAEYGIKKLKANHPAIRKL